MIRWMIMRCEMCSFSGAWADHPGLSSSPYVQVFPCRVPWCVAACLCLLQSAGRGDRCSAQVCSESCGGEWSICKLLSVGRDSLGTTPSAARGDECKSSSASFLQCSAPLHPVVLECLQRGARCRGVLKSNGAPLEAASGLPFSSLGELWWS